MKKIYLGTMDIVEEKMKSSIKNALDAGFYGIDTAWRYHNESIIGQSLAGLRTEGYKNIKVQTKIWPDFFDDPLKILKVQLKALQLQQVDSLLLHRPSVDFRRSINAWKELIKIKKLGLTKKIGVSNFDKDMIEILVQATNVVPEINQIEMSVTNFRDDRLHYLQKHQIEPQGWSPMGKDIKRILNNDIVVKLASKYNVSAATIAISYLTSQGIVPILKSTTKSHIFEMQNLVMLTQTEINDLKTYNTYHNKASETYTYREILNPKS